MSLIMPTIQVIGAVTNQDSISDEGSDLQVGLNAGFCDKYLWRGVTWNKGLVIQPEVVLTYKDFSLSSWGNIGLNKVDVVDYNEIDFTLGYYHSFNSFDIESYLSYFYYLNQDFDATAEFNLGIYYPLGDFTLFARSSIDVLANLGGMYGEIGVDYEKELSDKFSLFGTVLTGLASKTFNEYYLAEFGYPEEGKHSFNLVSGNIGLSYSPFESFYIDADFLINFNVDNEVRSALGSSTNLIELVLRKEF